MTTHGATLILFDGEYRISSAASDAFFPEYGQMMADSIYAFVNYFDESKFQAAVRGSIQLSCDFDDYSFSDATAIKKILDAGVREPNIIPKSSADEDDWDSYNIWEIGESDDTEEQFSSLLSVSYSHNFIAQFMSGVFFRFYDKFDYKGISLEVLKDSRAFDIIVDMDGRMVYFEDYGDDSLIEVSFDDLIASQISLAALSNPS